MDTCLSDYLTLSLSLSLSVAACIFFFVSSPIINRQNDRSTGFENFNDFWTQKWFRDFVITTHEFYLRIYGIIIINGAVGGFGFALRFSLFNSVVWFCIKGFCYCRRLVILSRSSFLFLCSCNFSCKLEFRIAVFGNLLCCDV